jgi:hypothetical protein
MRITTALVIGSLGVSVFAGPVMTQETRSRPLLDKGTQELSLSGRLEAPGSGHINYDIDASYGYFFRDGWEIGAQVLAADFGGMDRIEIAGFSEYNFKRQSNIVPYVGGAIGLVSADFGDNLVLSSTLNDNDGLLFDMEGGVKFFVRPYMAISLAIDFKFSTDDVFATKDSVDDNLTAIKIGMRYYF